MQRLLVVISLPLLLLCANTAPAAPDLPGLIQMIDYVAADYPEAVADGRVIDAGEYAEMQDFAAAIVARTAALPAAAQRDRLRAAGERLGALVADKAAPAQVAALAAELRRGLIAAYNVTATPRRAPDLERARGLYAEHCAACHGAEGRGDGPAAAGLKPAPTNFQDRERYAQRTLYGLYSTITHGVHDTAMQAYGERLDDDARWGLAFHVGALATTAPERAAGKAALARGEATELTRPERLTTLSPAEAEAEYGPAGGDVMAYLRARPDSLFGAAGPIQHSRDGLGRSLAAYAAGDAGAAYDHAVDAYLEGFELVEQGLQAVAPALRDSIEAAMTAYRARVRAGAPLAELEQRAAALDAELDAAAQRLETDGLSGTTAFAGAFVILVREGLEALLVVAALAAFLIRTERRDALPYLHAGWLAALVLGGLTWLLAARYVNITGAQRELTEGVAALVAMVVLFYVGFWLHNKAHAAQWQRFIRDRVQRALNARTLWALAGLSFIAVYREVFETLLFYQALWMQTDAGSQGMAVGGVVAAAGVLGVLAWLILRYSTRLPLRQFFGTTGVLMFVLALVFAGKGVAALQEAGMLPVDSVSFPRIDLLGIYPNLQSLALQAALVALGVLLLLTANRRAQRAQAHA